MSNPLYVLDVIQEVVVRADVLAIIYLSQVDRKLCKLCNNNYLFTRLIKLHYPNCKFTSNPKNQYLSLIANKETEYCTRVCVWSKDYITNLKTSDNCIDLFLYNGYLYRDNCDCNVRFTIKGIRPKDDEIYWLSIKCSFMSPIEYAINPFFNRAEVFLTKEAAVNNLLNTNVCENNSRSELFDRIMATSFYYFFSENLDPFETIIYQFVKVLIHNSYS